MIRLLLVLAGACSLTLAACNNANPDLAGGPDDGVAVVQAPDDAATETPADTKPTDSAEFAAPAPGTDDSAKTAAPVADPLTDKPAEKPGQAAVERQANKPIADDAAAKTPSAADPAKSPAKPKAKAARGELTIELPKGFVRAIEDVQVPGKEPGQLLDLKAIEGQVVEEGAVLAVIDDRDAQISKEVKQLELTVETEKAKDEVEKEFARASYNVAEIDLRMSLEANKGGSKVVPEIEIEQKKLQKTRARLQYEKALKDQKIAQLSAKAKRGEVDAADLHIANRTIKAPFPGVVEQILKRKGEWVQAGEPVIRLIRIDKLRVEAFVDSTKYEPGDLIGRPVTVSLPMPNGSLRPFAGKVESVGTELIRGESEGLECRIWVAVQNQFNRSLQPVMRPGHEVSLKISVPVSVAKE